MRISLRVLIAATVLVTAPSLLAQNPPPQQIFLPPGLLIPVTSEEPIRASSAKPGDPVLFTVTRDVRVFARQTPVIPKGSKIIARIANAKKAGRFVGRAALEFEFAQLLTPDWSLLDIDAGLNTANKHDTNDGVIIGRGHAKRDVLGFLFPPTFAYQLIRLPARGPDLILEPEDVIEIKVMEAVTLQSSVEQLPNPAGRADARSDTPPRLLSPDSPRSALPVETQRELEEMKQAFSNLTRRLDIEQQRNLDLQRQIEALKGSGISAGTRSPIGTTNSLFQGELSRGSGRASNSIVEADGLAFEFDRCELVGRNTLSCGFTVLNTTAIQKVVRFWIWDEEQPEPGMVFTDGRGLEYRLSKLSVGSVVVSEQCTRCKQRTALVPGIPKRVTAVFGSLTMDDLPISGTLRIILEAEASDTDPGAIIERILSPRPPLAVTLPIAAN